MKPFKRIECSKAFPWKAMARVDQMSKEWAEIVWPDDPIAGIEAFTFKASERHGPIGWVPFGETLWIGLGSDGAPWVARRVV